MTGDAVILTEAEILTYCQILLKTPQAMKVTRKLRQLVMLPRHRLYTHCLLLHLAFHNSLSTARPLFKQKKSLRQMQSYGIAQILQSLRLGRGCFIPVFEIVCYWSIDRVQREDAAVDLNRIKYTVGKEESLLYLKIKSYEWGLLTIILLIYFNGRSLLLLELSK